MSCRCFWDEGGACLMGNDGNQETCPDHRERTNPETGEAWGKVNEPPPRAEYQPTEDEYPD